ncbi:MAG: hypothetical protein H6726_12855 [Sandaracinaceae bacterium]|nr:hypothetical protein [Sandaracinaceae bacterium]
MTMMVGAAGATVALGSAEVVIPSGALAQDTMITITETTMPTPAGYRAFSPLYQFEPEGTAFAQPIQVTLPSSAASADVPLATLFWSRNTADGGGWQRLGGIPTTGAVTGEAEHFSYGFIADGVDYTANADRSCVRTRILDNRTADPSGVALFFAMEDCWGRPITDLSQSQLDSGEVVVEENGIATSSEAQTTLLERRGLQVFVTLSIDMSTSTTAVLSDVIAASRQFVETLQEPARGLVDKVQVGIQLFAGEATPTLWQPHTLDLALVLTQLDALSGYTVPDPGSTNLHGGVVDALARSGSAQQAFRTRNEGGAFTSGYVVLFTDGADTAGLLPANAAVAAIGATTDEVLAVGLVGRDYSASALASLVGEEHVIDSPDPVTLGRDFSHLAARIAGQVRRTYLLGYCSPKRSGTHTVVISLDGATSQTWGDPTTFDATGFGPDCTTASFTDACSGMECGGLGCGACDDRVDLCSSGTCVDHCDTANICGGDSFTNSLGYDQICTDAPGRMLCDAACRDEVYLRPMGGACMDISIVDQFGTSGQASRLTVSTDNAGAIIFCGTFPARGGAGGNVGIMHRYLPNRSLDWAQDVGDDLVRCVSLSDGSIVALGLQIHASDGLKHPFLARYSASGAEMWKVDLAQSISEVQVQHVAASNEILAVVGSTNVSLNGTPISGTTDAFAMFFDASGDLVRTLQFGSSSGDDARRIEFYGDGGWIVSGNAGGSIGGTGNTASRGVYSRRYSADNSEIWTAQHTFFGTYIGKQVTGSCALDDGGGIEVGIHDSDHGSNSYIRRYDVAGSVLWNHTFGLTGDEARSVRCNGESVVVTGETGSNIGETGSDAERYMFLREYDLSGSAVRTRQLNANGTFGYDIEFLFDGSVAVVGTTPVALEGFSQTGLTDAFVAEIRRP